jgi:hypothetical protein
MGRSGSLSSTKTHESAAHFGQALLRGRREADLKPTWTGTSQGGCASKATDRPFTLVLIAPRVNPAESGIQSGRRHGGSTAIGPLVAAERGPPRRWPLPRRHLHLPSRTGALGKGRGDGDPRGAFTSTAYGHSHLAPSSIARFAARSLSPACVQSGQPNLTNVAVQNGAPASPSERAPPAAWRRRGLASALETPALRQPVASSPWRKCFGSEDEQNGRVRGGATKQYPQ